MRSRTLLAGVALATAALLPLGGSAGAATLVGQWHMDESSGATVMHDSSGHGNDGRIDRARTGVEGIRGSAYEFGNPSIVTVPSSASLNPGDKDITISEYVRAGGTPGHWNLTQKGYSTTAGGFYKLAIEEVNHGTIGKAACQFRGSVRIARLTGGPNVVDNAWHHLECIKRQTSITLVVDGKSYTKNVTIGSISNGKTLNVGAKMLGDDQYIGRIDELSIVIG